MSWTVEIVDTSDGAEKCRFGMDHGHEYLDANNCRILIDALLSALDILQPDLGVKPFDANALYTCKDCGKTAMHPNPHVCEKEAT